MYLILIFVCFIGFTYYYLKQKPKRRAQIDYGLGYVPSISVPPLHRNQNNIAIKKSKLRSEDSEKKVVNIYDYSKKVDIKISNGIFIRTKFLDNENEEKEKD